MSFDSDRGEELAKGFTTQAGVQDSLDSSDESALERSQPSNLAASTEHPEIDEKERKRKLNRQSKSRCRQRRNELIKKLEVEIARLSAEQKSLHSENEKLRQEFDLCCEDHREQLARRSQVDQIFVALSRITGNQSNASNPILTLLQIQASLNLFAPQFSHSFPKNFSEKNERP